MLDFSSWLDLPLIWAIILAVGVFLYVALDGFDLGCGIIFPFAPSQKCQERIVNSIAPFWDGNETWLVLGGGGLFAAFPVAYSILMPALYIPIILMLLGLIFRGVAFEFRLKASVEKRSIWDNAFHGGSLLASFMQGVILGNIIQGVTVSGRAFAGGPLDWVNTFSIFTGLALVFGYALLGATWLIMKTEDTTQTWARKVARYTVVYVVLFMCLVVISKPFFEPRISEIWFNKSYSIYLLIIPVVALYCFMVLWKDLKSTRDIRPFFTVILLFFTCFLGLCISLFPWIVPFSFTIWDAAAASTSQSLLLIGTVLFLPLILAYTAYSYYVFRGKSSHEKMY